MADKRTQCNTLLEHFENGGSITDTEANIQYSIGRLAARVCDLRKRGYPVKSEWEKGINQFGEPCRYKRYFMGSDSGG